MWSTRWDAHAGATYLGSYESEERAARAHDLATLVFAVQAAVAAAGGNSEASVTQGAVAAATPLLNYAVSEYPGVEELGTNMSHSDFLNVILSSARETSERRYSRFRGVYRSEAGGAGGAELWESRVEEAPASAAAAAAAAAGAGAPAM